MHFLIQTNAHKKKRPESRTGMTFNSIRLHACLRWMVVVVVVVLLLLRQTGARFSTTTSPRAQATW